MKEQSACFQFDTVEVSPASFTVHRDGQRLNVEPKAIRVLIHLIVNRHRVVTKDELVESVWEGTAVTDNAVTRVIAQLRRELGDDPKTPRFIETVPTLGYRFIATVQQIQASHAPPVEDTPAAAPTMPKLAAPAAALILIAGGWWFTHRSTPAAIPRKAEVQQITTGTGVDAKPSFGPDDRSFVYSSNRTGRFELYRRELDGNAATRQITDDANQNVQPAWSPDGKWIAYHSAAQRGIWIVPALGGAPRRLTQFGSSPAWSPDSRTVAFASAEPVSLAPFDSGGAGSLWTVALDGSAQRQVTTAGAPQGVHTSPSWSHDGKHLLYVALGRETTIHRIDVATGQNSVLVRAGVDIPRQPGTYISRAWDPVFGPGDQIVYFSAAGEKGEHSIWSVGAAGGSPRLIHSSRSDTPTGLSLARDGSRLLFTGMRSVSQLWTVAEGGETKPLFQEEVLRAYLPGYSADGKWLAFAVETQGRNRDFWVMPADGGEPVPVSPDAGPKEGGMVWTQAGELLYNYVDGADVEFRAFDPTTRKTRLIHKRNTAGLFHPVLMPNAKDLLSACSRPFNVCLGPITAANPRQLTFEREAATFVFSDRSGQWIAYQARRGDSEQIGVVRSDGTETKILTSDSGRNWSHSFSPDSRRIAYASFQKGVWTLWWIDRVSGERKQLTTESAFGPFVRSPAWRPHTGLLAYERFQVRGNIFALELP